MRLTTSDNSIVTVQANCDGLTFVLRQGEVALRVELNESESATLLREMHAMVGQRPETVTLTSGGQTLTIRMEPAGHLMEVSVSIMQHISKPSMIGMVKRLAPAAARDYFESLVRDSKAKGWMS